jgi:hypothetical protein
LRIIFLAGAALAIVGCGKNASQNNAVAAPDNRAAIVATAAPAGNAAVAATQGAPMNAAAAADRAPPAMLGDDPDAQGAGCVVFLGQAEPAGAEYARASAAWRAGLVRRLGEDGAAQLIGSSVNPLEDTPPAARRAAVDWCAAHPPAGG